MHVNIVESGKDIKPKKGYVMENLTIGKINSGMSFDNKKEITSAKTTLLGQLNFFDELQKEISSEHPVVLDNACEWKKGELHKYKINTTYSDVVLLISMLHEYIEMLNDIDGVRMEYYRNRFKAITEYLEKGIDYDYQERSEKCRKRIDKDDRLDENWIGR